MKKQSLIVLVSAAAMLVGLPSLVLAQAGSVVAAVPGNTVVVDEAGDLQLRNCNPSKPGLACSIPPTAPLSLPGYFDINTTKITQIGNGRVDLSITLQEPIPEAPPQGFIAYIWQFEGGCVDPQPGNKAGVQVVWHGASSPGYWEANWFEIINCSPRAIEKADPIEFQFTDDGVKVRGELSDLLTAIDPGDPLVWYAAVRRVPFIYQPDSVLFTTTIPVDFAPNVVALTPEGVEHPEDPAIWLPRVPQL
jgi:hypothetical protein